MVISIEYALAKIVRDTKVNFKKILNICRSAVIIAAAYFFYQEFKNNAEALREYNFAFILCPFYIDDSPEHPVFSSGLSSGGFA